MIEAGRKSGTCNSTEF